MTFPPVLPEQVDVYLRVALLLAAALGFAEAGQRFLHLPRLSGYILAGMLLGPGVLNWVPISVTGDFRPLLLLGLGLLLFELGSRVDLRWLRANPVLILSSLAESALTFVGVYLFLDFFGNAPSVCTSVAAIAVSSSPTVIMRVVAENNSRGQMTQRLLLLAALNTLYGILLLKVGIGLVHLERVESLLDAVAHPLYMACGSFLAAAVVAYLMKFSFSTILKRESERFAAVIAVLLVAISAADGLGLSVPMVLLISGMLLRSRSSRIHVFPEHFGSTGAAVVILLFVLTGVALTPEQIVAGGAMSLGLLAIRGSAKYIGVVWTAGRSGLSPAKAHWLGFALLPMSSLAVLQAYDVAGLYPDLGQSILSVILGAVFTMELVGPILTQTALRRAGETAPDAAAEKN